MPDFSLEDRLAARQGLPVAGIDEAGRGPWAGPVVAAAVILHSAHLPPRLADALDDSKRVKPDDRDALHAALFDLAAAGHAHIALGRAEVEEIDSRNILAATMAAMARAVAALAVPPAAALVDGNRVPDLPCPAEPVIKGDARSLSVAAASIIAKVSRDREMAALARRYPGYGWERNRGYGTAEHQAALCRLGPTPQHRHSFRPVRDCLGASRPD